MVTFQEIAQKSGLRLVRILASADAHANIPDAATIKIFTLDSSYRPIAECKTQTNK